jgi:hypothetical protein
VVASVCFIGKISVDTAQILPLLAAVVGSIAFIIFSGLSWRAFRAARIIAANPPRPISELAAGPTEVKGILHGAGRLESAIAQRACLYTRLIIEQYRKNKWESVVERKSSVDVWLDDGSGRVHVFPEAAQVIVASPKRAQTGIFEVPSQDLSKLLEQIGEAPEILGAFVRWREEILEQGDSLHAVGVARKENGRWELHGADNFHVLSDRDDAEVIRMWQRNAWQRIGVGLLSLVAAAWGIWSLLQVSEP